MQSAPVRLRTDLVVSRQESAGGDVYIVKDPATRRFFRFGEAEQFIAAQLDGSTPLETVRQRVEEKFGEPLDEKTLDQFVDTLRRCGFLETERAADAPQPVRSSRFLSNPLYFRLKAFDPDALLNRMSPYFRFFFTPWFVAISASVTLLGFAVTAANWSEIWRDVSRLYRFDALLIAWLTVLTVTAAHEFAHALTCKRFGGEVHEMGFLLIYFQPAFYCNISDAWLFPKKSRRLWVTFAGAYFEIFVWAAATLIWRVVEPGTAISFFALVVMATSGVKTMFNLNPLIKLDGYYLLSDLLEIPNLRNRSFKYISGIFRKISGGAPRETSTSDAKPGHRRVYVVYGLLAGVYSFLLLGAVASQLGGYLVGRFQGFGFLLFSAFLMITFQNPIRKILPKMGRASSPAGPRTILSRRNKILLGLAVLLAFLFFGRMELRISSEFRILPAQKADVRAQVEGILAQVNVEEGGTVAQGAIIARLADRDFQSDLQRIEALIAERTARLKILTIGPRAEEIELAQKSIETARTRRQYAADRFEEARRIQTEGFTKARASVAKADEQVKYASKRLESSRLLFAQGLTSREELEKAEEEIAVRTRQREEAQADQKMGMADALAEHRRSLAVAEKELDEAQSRLRILLAGSRPEEREAVQAEIASLDAQRLHVLEQLRLVQVVSPISGVVITQRPKEMIGQHVRKGDVIVNIHELKTVTAEILSPEKEIGEVRVGQQVVLKTRAYPMESFAGKVASIAPVATRDKEGLSERTVLVTCHIENQNLMLKPEMTGKAKIYCGQRRILDVLTQRAARYLRVEFWSWW